MLTGEVPPKQDYWLCRRSECDAVYYGRDDTVLTTADMNVTPGFKSSSPEALVCYCFQYRRGDIEAELAAKGRTSIPDRIAAEIKAGNCACEVRNPSGRCCLGDVNETIRELSVGLGAEARQANSRTPASRAPESAAILRSIA